jgi:hypothetical protein
MANTYTSLHYHIIFSTKNREPWLGIYRRYRARASQCLMRRWYVRVAINSPPQSDTAPTSHPASRKSTPAVSSAEI